MTDPGKPYTPSVVTETVIQSTASGTGTTLAPSPESGVAKLKPPVSSPWRWWRRWSPWNLTRRAAPIAAPSATPGPVKAEGACVASAKDMLVGGHRTSCAARSVRGLTTTASRPVRLLLDTGAAAFLVTGEQGTLCEVSDSRRVSAKDAQGHLFEATGGGPLWGMVPTAHGPRLKLLTDQLFQSSSLEDGLGGYAPMRRLGWRLQDRATGAFLVAPDGDEVELEVDDEGLLWLHFDAVPPDAAPAPAPEVVAGQLNAQMARIPTSGAPIRLGGARTPVHWPSRLPGPDTEDSPESSRQDAQLKIKVPPDRPDEYPLETSRRDEEPTLEDPPGMSQRAARPKL